MLYPYRKSTWAVIVFLLVIWPAFSILVSSLEGSPAEITNLTLQVYLPTFMIQLLLILMVTWALIRAEEGRDTVGLVKFNIRNFVTGVLFLVFAIIFFNFLSQLVHGLEQPEEIQQLLPRTNLDYLAWMVLSFSAAVGEEISFRGFLITRLTPVLGNYWAAALLSSVSFGIGHMYQGVVGIIFTAIYGFLFAILFYWRKSIFPCIIAHFLQDALAPWLYSLPQNSP